MEVRGHQDNSAGGGASTWWHNHKVSLGRPGRADRPGRRFTGTAFGHDPSGLARRKSSMLRHLFVEKIALAVRLVRISRAISSKRVFRNLQGHAVLSPWVLFLLSNSYHHRWNKLFLRAPRLRLRKRARAALQKRAS